ncbi:unnamed protein product [Heligmosomoides polygyrus]|uniref:mRNA cap 0 methyltransferase domain-containing protein n=1 Tax=Heligmosomoides polygyrus TaxID=6339 RepID=A0A183FQK4_HELPZ|nr:unnamed protein product [Heligmosomoides polygyrus]
MLATNQFLINQTFYICEESLDLYTVLWSVRENDGEFSNEVCSLRYENKDELEKPPLFGAMFHFTLDSQVNCPEFLAYFPLVKQ